MVALQQASFKGVPFQVAEHGLRIDRQIAKYPLANAITPVNEDLGRQGRSYQVQAWLVGKNYALARDRLLQACLSAGAGVLIHPYLGLLKVHCQQAQINENAQEQQFTKLNLQFIEAGQTSLDSTSNTLPLIATLEKVRDANQQQFLNTALYDTPQQLELGLLTVSDVLQQITREIHSPGVATASLLDAFSQIGLQAANLARAPVDIAQIIPAALQTLNQSGLPISDSLQAYQKIYQGDTISSSPTVARFVQDSALTESVYTLSHDDKYNNEDVLSQLDYAIENRLLQTHHYVAFQTWQSLQKIMSQMNHKDQTYSQAASLTQPWLVFAITQGTLDNLGQNYPRHPLDYPLWVSPGKKIKLLRDKP